MKHLIPGICTQCGATLSVYKEKDAMVCPYCNTPFIVEKAIKIFNTTYIDNSASGQNAFAYNTKKDFEIIAGVLVRYTGMSLNVTIPNGVIAIGQGVFANTKIQSINMPESVTEIRIDAFRSCTNLKDVVLSSNVTKIRDYAFADCNNLENIILSSNLQTIGSCAFSGTKKLKLVLPDSIEEISTYGYGGYALGCKSIYVSSYLLNKLSSLPSGTKDIYIDEKKLTLLELKNDRKLREKFWNSAFRQDLVHFEDEEEREEDQKRKWKSERKCQYCGGNFKGGLFTALRCNLCGKEIDY